MLLIKNVLIADPKTLTENVGDIFIQDGKIKYMTVHEAIEAPEGAKVIDGTGLVAGPGLIDVHVHFRDPGLTYKEDIYTGAAAAKAGGFTTVVMMANTKPPIDNVETLTYVLEKGRKTGIHVESCATVTKGMQGRELVDMEALKAAGAIGFTDDGIPLLDEAVTRKAMETAAKLRVPISFHEEDPAYIENNGVNRGKASEYYHIGGSSREAEISMVARDIEIALQTGASMDVQHISAKEAVELVRQGKKRGSNIYAEATPHHIALTEEAVIRHGTLAKMNPPLRTTEDRLAIIQGLVDGSIDMIATDHAPHSAEEKSRPLTEAPSGIIGLETALAIAVTCLVKPGYLSYAQLMEKMSYNPAKLYHLEATRGHLSVGADADLVLFDPNEEWTVGNTFASKAVNSPFIGETLTGKVAYTICGGSIVYTGCIGGKENV